MHKVPAVGAEGYCAPFTRPDILQDHRRTGVGPTLESFSRRRGINNIGPLARQGLEMFPRGREIVKILSYEPIEPIVPNLEARRNQPHITGYSRILGHESTLCLCADPESHGDAFSRHRHPADQSNLLWSRGPVRDVQGNEISWEVACHRLVDAAGKESISGQETLPLLRRVYDKMTAARLIDEYRAMDEELREGAVYHLEADVIW